MLRHRAVKVALAVCLVMGFGAWTVGGPANRAAAGEAGFVSSESLADGGCRHTIKVRNDGSRTVKIHWAGSSVRTRIGTWKQLYGGGYGIFYRTPSPSDFPVVSDGSHSWIYTTDFGCNARRRWRFHLSRSDGKEHMLYIPSSSSFTTNTTIDLGNVGRSRLW